MTINIIMPKLSDTMTDGQFICWRKNVGEAVERGDVLAEIETDKAVMELESFASGILIKTIAQAGEIVPVGTVLGLIGEEGELSEVTETAPQAVRPGETEVATAGRMQEPDAPPAQGHESGEHEKASPIVRRMAREQGIDLTRLQGSGPEGRITQDDLQTYISTGKGKPEPAGSTPKASKIDFTEVPPRQQGSTATSGGPSAMRQAVAATVSRSWREIPHYGITSEIAMDVCQEIVNELRVVRHGIGYNALIIKACAAALEHYPKLHTADVTTGGIAINFTVALPDGLLMPVIKDCQRLSVDEIGYETSRLKDKSRTGHLSADEMSGGGFSVSNLGMYDVDEFFALILPGQVAILAVGTVADRPLVRDGQLVVAPTMRVTLSCDHRVIDGAYAASFLAELRRILEQPLSLLL